MSSPGTRPTGTHDERQAASYVREMFSRIAPRYDFLNHLLSFNLDRVWRRRTARHFRHILARSGARALDLCCGTGDLTMALDRVAAHDAAGSVRNPRGASVFGSDFAHPMLVRAVSKSCIRSSADFNGGCTVTVWRIPYFEGDALCLPVANASFDLVTCAFGFRNLANYDAGLREMYRILRPGGEVGIVEFAAPRNRVFAAVYRLYFTQILPRVGGAVSGSKAAYSYLPESVASFPEPEDFRALMSAVGFAEARSHLWTMGAVALHTARKP